MSLRGQGGRIVACRRRGAAEAGYAMAALLVALAVMAVMMSVALPVWRHDAQREKEEELVFRGQQYVRAIRLYQTKTGALPVSVDSLVQGRYLRKKYKDPITGEDFEPISAANPNPGGVTGSTRPGAGGTQQTIGGGLPSTGRLGANSDPNGSTFGGTVPGGMLGVRSKSKDESIRLYLNRNHYNEWMFVFQGNGPGQRVQPDQRNPAGRRGGPNGPNGPIGPNGPGGVPFPPGRGPGAGRGRGGPGGFTPMMPPGGAGPAGQPRLPDGRGGL
jgi:type II secretory pathway pseudopilin PulG